MQRVATSIIEQTCIPGTAPEKCQFMANCALLNVLVDIGSWQVPTRMIIIIRPHNANCGLLQCIATRILMIIYYTIAYILVDKQFCG